MTRINRKSEQNKKGATGFLDRINKYQVKIIIRLRLEKMLQMLVKLNDCLQTYSQILS